jgi:hypothetical protein
MFKINYVGGGGVCEQRSIQPLQRTWHNRPFHRRLQIHPSETRRQSERWKFPRNSWDQELEHSKFLALLGNADDDNKRHTGTEAASGALICVTCHS